MYKRNNHNIIEQGHKAIPGRMGSNRAVTRLNTPEGEESHITPCKIRVGSETNRRRLLDNDVDKGGCYLKQAAEV